MDSNKPDCCVNDMAKNPNGARSSMGGVPTGAGTPPNPQFHNTVHTQISPTDNSMGYKRFEQDA